MTKNGNSNCGNNCDLVNPRCEGPKISVKNPHLEELEEDVLYHLGLSTSADDLRHMFGDVKFVCVGGTPERMKSLAEYIKEVLEINCSEGEQNCLDITKSGRYEMYKAGPVLCVTHGIGSPSLSVVLHEIIKLMHYANVKDPIFLRMGTSGGIGVPPSSVVITSTSVDGMLRPYQELIILGKKVQRPSELDPNIARELKLTADKHMKNCSVVIGKTMCTDDFYEGQGRLDGAFCEYNNDDKLAYLQRLKEEGVVNIEMESLTFAAMCKNAGFRAGVLCVTLVDRLQGDQVNVAHSTLKEWQERLIHLVAMFINSKLSGEIS